MKAVYYQKLKEHKKVKIWECEILLVKERDSENEMKKLENEESILGFMFDLLIENNTK